MHIEPPAPASADDGGGPWYRGLTRYHYFVLIVAALGWLFDTMDQQLFTLARTPALAELLKKAESDPKLGDYEGLATMIFMIGWASGGIVFGIMGDRVGRARTMLLTILIYSVFTGLSALSQGFLDFVAYRFLTGLGVGGEFAVGVSLVAEVMPDRARPRALGWVQASSALGNMIAGGIGIGFGLFLSSKNVGGAWRGMFVVGMLPALLVIFIRRRLKEPERWEKTAATGDERKLGSISELFGDPRWRRNTIVGMLLAFSGVVGLWGIGFFAPRLIRTVFDQTFRDEGLRLGLDGSALAEYIKGRKTLWTGITSLIQNFGAFWGAYTFSRITQRTGRKPAFAVSFVLAMGSTAFTFWYLSKFSDIFWMIPIMGFCQMTLFGGYAIYFPELFPTRLRSTGTSFCYNVGRLVAAVGPLALGKLESVVYQGYSQPLRYAGVTMCSVFLIGLCALPFAPETRGKPLPE